MMTQGMPLLLDSLFGVDKLEDISLAAIQDLVTEFPSFNAAHFLLSQKLQAENDEAFAGETRKTALYFNNPVWLHSLLLPDTIDDIPEKLFSYSQTPIERVEDPVPETNWESPVDASDPVEPVVLPQPEVPVAEVAESDAHIIGSEWIELPPSVELSNEFAAINNEENFYSPETTDTHEFVAPVASIHSWEKQDLPESVAPVESIQMPETSAPDNFTETEEVSNPPEIAEHHEHIEPVEYNYHPEILESQEPDPTDESVTQAVIAESVTHESLAHETTSVPDEPIEAPRHSETVHAFVNAVEYSFPTLDLQDMPSPVPVAESTTPALTPEMPHETVPDYGGSFEQEAPLEMRPISHFDSKKAESIVFEPYHVIDYFASQGIKLVIEDHPTDAFSKQLKSFTDWLKIMKRIPQKPLTDEQQDLEADRIRHFAAHSIEEKDVVTEAMAEVLAKQGMYQNAIALYQKLSLLYPAKSAYFAGRIEQLKPAVL